MLDCITKQAEQAIMDKQVAAPLHGAPTPAFKFLPFLSFCPYFDDKLWYRSKPNKTFPPQGRMTDHKDRYYEIVRSKKKWPRMQKPYINQ